MIVLLHPAPAYGAVERYVAAIARAIRALLVFSGVSEFDALPVQTVEMHPSVGTLTRFLRASRPRLVHVTDVWPQALVAARLARVPRILVTHHTPELPRQDNLAGRAWQRLGWCRPEPYHRPKPTAQARPVPSRRCLSGSAQSASPQVVRRSTSAMAARSSATSRASPSRRITGRCSRRPLVPEADFAIAGDGELRGELERAAGPNVRFLGTRTDVPDVLASLDVFAFPSLFEGLCLAVIEAQTAGVPVVATAVGGIKETVVDGETGLLVPPRDPEALAAAIRRLLDHPEEAARLAEEARRRALERYSEEQMVSGTLALYG